MYFYNCEHCVETCTIVYVRMLNSPNRHSKRASPDHGRDSTIPVTMWTFSVTFCCRSTVPITKTSKFQPWKWTLSTPILLVAPGSMRHVMTINEAWFPLQLEPRLSTLSISGREQSQQCRHPRWWRRRTGGQNWVQCSKTAWKST